MAEPTNTELEQRIKKYISQRLGVLRREVKADMELLRNSVNTRLQPFHDYLVGQDAVVKASLTKPSGEINKGKLLEMTVQALVTAVAIIAVLLGVKAV